MKRATFILLSIILLFTPVGCKIDGVGALEQAGDLQLILPNQEAFPVPKNSPLWTWVANWLQDNQAGWTSSPASYVPGYVLKGNDFNLNLNEGFAVLNFKDAKGKYHQFFKEFSASEFGAFKQAAGI
jgi:hypothetical protein